MLHKLFGTVLIWQQSDWNVICFGSLDLMTTSDQIAKNINSSRMESQSVKRNLCWPKLNLREWSKHDLDQIKFQIYHNKLNGVQWWNNIKQQFGSFNEADTKKSPVALLTTHTDYFKSSCGNSLEFTTPSQFFFVSTMLVTTPCHWKCRWDPPSLISILVQWVWICYHAAHRRKQLAVVSYVHPSLPQGPSENCSHSSQEWLVLHQPRFLGSLSGTCSTNAQYQLVSPQQSDILAQLLQKSCNAAYSVALPEVFVNTIPLKVGQCCDRNM